MRTAYVRALNLSRTDPHSRGMEGAEWQIILSDHEVIVGVDIRSTMDKVQRAVVYVVSDPIWQRSQPQESGPPPSGLDCDEPTARVGPDPGAA